MWSRPLERRQLGDGRPAELAAPDHQRVVEQAALLQVGQERGDRPVPLAGELAVVRFEVVVVVPGLAGAAPDLDEPHAALEQPPGDQELPGRACRGRTARGSACGSRLDVEGVGRLGLHPVGQLERLDARLELRVVLAAVGVPLVEPSHQVELPALLVGSRGVVADVLDQLVDVGVLGVDVGPLVGAGQEAPTASSAWPTIG